MKPAEKKLLKVFSKLNEQQKTSLLHYAEFLLEKGSSNSSVVEEIPEPQLKERPEDESVVGAIKRLTASYPMLERDKLFNETSSLMTRHVMQGEEAAIIIDELEQLFLRHYKLLVEETEVYKSQNENNEDN